MTTNNLWRAGQGLLLVAALTACTSNAEMGRPDAETVVLEARAAHPALAALLDEGTDERLAWGDGSFYLGPVVGGGTMPFPLGSPAPRRPWRQLAVDLPERADGEVSVRLLGDRRRVGIRRPSASDRPGAAQGGVVVYAGDDATAGSMWLPSGGGVEEILVVPPGIATVDYALTLPEGAALEPLTPHVVQVRDRGRPWLRVEAYEGWTSTGSVPVLVDVVDATVLRVTLPMSAETTWVDPRWRSVKDAMTASRWAHTVTLLENSGRVLLAGGLLSCGQEQCGATTAEIYDPTCPDDDDSCASFEPTSGPMAQGRGEHAATWLPDGRVLLTGGDSPHALTSVELYDPILRRFDAASPMALPRSHHTLTLLATGDVLIIGGDWADTAEVFNPATDTLRTLAEKPCLAGRHHHTATLLADGRVLLAGGRGSGAIEAVRSAEIFDPQTETFECLGDDALTEVRLDHTATLLPSGDVVLMGGRVDENTGFYLDSIELFRASTGVFERLTSMPFGRAQHVAALMDDGRVLVVGGAAGQTTGIFDPATGSFGDAGKLGVPRTDSAGTRLVENRFLVAGGLPGPALKDAEVFFPGTVGESCADSAECDSGGHCVDGVCCESACEGLCMACNRGLKGYGEDGICEPIQSGVDPDRECEKGDFPADSCSDDGVCNGEARCQYGCERPGYVCREGRCAAPCVSSVDCVVDYRCNAAGECVKADERGISLPDEGICIRCEANDRRGEAPPPSVVVLAILGVGLLGLRASRRRRA